MEDDEFLQVLRSPFHFATCDAVLRGCKIVDISKPPQWRRLSKKVRSPLGPSARGLPPPLRGTAPPLAQSPPPPVSGESVSQREAFRQPEPLRRQGI